MTKFFIAFLLTIIAVHLEIAGNWLYILPTIFMVADIVVWVIEKSEQ